MRYQLGKIWIHILAFFVARCQLLGMYPFVVPFFMAAYLQEQSSISLFAALLLGVASTLQPVAALKYGLVLLALLVLLKRTDRKVVFENNLQIALASGVVLWAVSMPYEYIITGKDRSLIYALLEGVIACCGVLVFEQGLVALRVGAGRMFATNERFIGVFALMVTALFGCPTIRQPVWFLFILCGCLLLSYAYRFGGSVALAVGSVTGLVLAFEDRQTAWLLIMLVLASLLVFLRGLGRIGGMLGFFAGYLLLGFLYERSLFSQELLTSVLVVLAIFGVMPRSLLRQRGQEREGSTAYSQDIMMQEVVKSRISDFGQAFITMEHMLAMHEQDGKMEIPNGLSNMYLSGDGISLLNAVESQSNRLAEMRHNFVKQFGQIGEIILSFPGEMTEQSVKAELFEGQVTESFGRLGVLVTKAVLCKDKEERLEAHVSCLLEQEQRVTGDILAKRISKLTNRPMICKKRGDEMVDWKESRYSFIEEGRFYLTTGIVRKNREGESQCGDNFSISKIDTQKAVLMLSDGMGSGENAYIKSEQVVELLEQLLSAGFCRELAIELLNSFISFLTQGSAGTTLDLTMIDFYTGTADFIKLGASTTYIKRKNGPVECIRSTSLPVGVLEQVEFDTCRRKLYDGDILVMVSDGVVDGIIFENKDTYLADLIASIRTNNVQSIAEQIMEEISTMQRGSLRDDSTVLVAGVWER